MCISMKYIVWIACFFACAANGLGFNTQTIKNDIEYVDGMMVADFDRQFVGDDIVLIGRNKQRHKLLQWVALNNGKEVGETPPLIRLPDDILFYDSIVLATTNADGEQALKTNLVFLTPSGIQRFDSDTKTVTPLVDTKSIYRSSFASTSFMSRLKFSHDINGDGLTDLLIADFERFYIFTQQANGQFADPQVIDMVSQRRFFRNNSAVYSGAPVLVNDFNFDGEVDLIFRLESDLHIFLQQNGQFARKAKVQPLNLDLQLNLEHDEFREDQSNLTSHWVRLMVDLNKDGLLDLITQVTKSAGLLDKSSRYHIHFGQKQDGTTTFNPKQDAVIATEGLQFELKLVDFNDDDLIDLVSPSYELGVGSIIGSLFSSSADIDIAFHPLIKGQGYSEKPKVTKELTVDFNLSSGQQVYPLLLVADFDGDGISDLLTGHSGKKIYWRKGEKTKRVFARRAEKFKMKLPRNGQLISGNDFNQDGKMDLLLRYDRMDGIDLSKQLKVLLSQ